jgi:ATP-dependent Lhr-like helicase
MCAPEVRTGDTTAAQRQALIKTAAHSRAHARISVSAAHLRIGPDMLRTVRTLIVDEIHAVADDRGAHLALVSSG